MRVIIWIELNREIFGKLTFPISFPSYHLLCQWLSKSDNHNLIKKVLSIRESYDS